MGRDADIRTAVTTIGSVWTFHSGQICTSPTRAIIHRSIYDQVVEGLGGYGEFVTEPDGIRPAIERAFASGKPACVNVITDPEPPGVIGGADFM